ncbi:transmembrane protein [Raphidocelis subcapitata]|uniref:Transmembrane protein n=1 Tax=Raphidocelis subcapitata TaxID=307507 RepID=A0A2V0NLL2_9CHLO|nr:transmembrane protein [Raphidocelis subcapitata]|eukprot:GBF88318.1 transmembrane protein [Raphidocelis subcapitata]
MHPGTARARPVLTSLPLQVFIYFGGWWDALFWVLSVALFIYKGLALPYPPGRFAAEFTFVWLWLLVEPGRLFLGSKGNKTEQPGPLLFSLLLAVPIVAFLVYHVKFQTYVLKLEVLLNAISLSFLGLQVLLGCLATARFVGAARVA